MTLAVNFIFERFFFVPESFFCDLHWSSDFDELRDYESRKKKSNNMLICSTLFISNYTPSILQSDFTHCDSLSIVACHWFLEISEWVNNVVKKLRDESCTQS